MKKNLLRSNIYKFLLSGNKNISKPFTISNKFYSTQTEEKKPYFNKILISNRGEIACRVMKTAHKLGIKTVAIYSDADEKTKHVQMATESYHIGPSVVSQSYNKISTIVQAVKDTGAEAVHPGFGFLSENPDFSHALKENGIVFIGPPESAMRAMGDKIESKKIAKAAKVNTIPGFEGNIENEEQAVKEAKKIGYPVMIKASRGGGGKGMRIAWNDEELVEGFKLSRREAVNNFGSDLMLIEKYIEEPRHIEIQVLCDAHGNGIYLGERECSIQRRNQKVIEEAPSSLIDPKTREAMGTQAVQLAKAVGYVSAGTVEMLVDKHKNFYFLEMNTRLQVEHPITEMVTGVDIVEEMIKIAAGHPLSIKQSDVKINGWATEARIYAEDPTDNFAPCVGRLKKYVEPKAENPNVRCDSGILQGTEISVYYDPMICKLIAYGKDREESRKLMIDALDEYIIQGVVHNISLLRSILENERYIAGKITTNLIKEEYPGGFHGIKLTDVERSNLISAAGLIKFLNNQRNNATEKITSDSFVIEFEKQTHQFKVVSGEGKYHITLDGEKIDAEFDWFPGQVFLKAKFSNSDVKRTIQLSNDPVSSEVELQFKGTKFHLFVMSQLESSLKKHLIVKPPPDFSKFLLSPMPGAIVGVSVKVGDVVLKGQELVVMEAMKMQNSLRSPAAGKVKKVNVKLGDIVKGKEKLVEFE